MSSDLAHFAARLRPFIATAARADDASFAALALELFALQFAANGAYRKICEARLATPLTVSHWTQIPAAPASAFKELDLTCLVAAQRLRVFHSSGTTDRQRSRHFHNAESLAVYEVSLWPWFRAHLLPDWSSEIRHLKPVILTPPPMHAPHSSLVHMFEVVRRKLDADDCAFVGRAEADGSWSMDLDAALARLTPDAGRRTPDAGTLLLGTAFSFVHLLDGLAERALRLQLPPGSRVMETGGYKGRSRSLSKAELHALITQRLGVPPRRIVCEYGMSELSSQAYDHALDALRNTRHATRVFRFPPWARAQITSPETGLEVGEGETGLLRVFDLANVFSVLAVQTEDLAIRRGDGFELLGSAANVEPRGCSLMAV